MTNGISGKQRCNRNGHRQGHGKKPPRKAPKPQQQRNAA
jgi:hypothetical protein